MDYFLTTYRKDFKWPAIQMTSEQKRSTNEQEVKEAALSDTKPCLKDAVKGSKAKVEENQGQNALLQKGGSVYLQKLFEKYPYLKNVMKFTNPDEMVKKIMNEKYKTTYQIEYNKDESHPSDNYAQMMDVLDTAEKINAEEKPVVSACAPEGDSKKCACAQGLSFAPCKCSKDAPVRKIAWKPAPISKIPQAPREKKKKKKDGEDTAQQAAGQREGKQIKPFRSEYNDTIGKVGGIIIKKKLLYKETQDEKPNKK